MVAHTAVTMLVAPAIVAASVGVIARPLGGTAIVLMAIAFLVAQLLVYARSFRAARRAERDVREARVRVRFRRRRVR